MTQHFRNNRLTTMGLGVISVLLLLSFLASSQAAIVNTERNLIEHLLRNSTREARPVLSQTYPTNVSFGAELVQLINVNDRYQTITSKLWVRQNWKNQLMAWNPKDYDNVQSVLIDAKLLWVPDIVLYNNAEDSFSGGTDKYKTKIILYSDGMHYWLSPGTFTSTCKIDITYFPFDRQVCILKFGSWAYDESAITMQPDKRPVITSNYINSSEWEIISGTKKANQVKYACCVHAYPDVTITLILQRKPLYYVFNVITPCLVLAMTILFGFFLPPESGERISLTITILLAVAVFLQLVSDNLPRNSDSVPILSIFYMVIMTESALSLITTCVVLVCHFHASARGVERPPQWIRKLFFQKISKFIKVQRFNIKDIKIDVNDKKSGNNVSHFCNDGFAESYVIPLEDNSLEARQPSVSPKLKSARNGVILRSAKGRPSTSIKPLKDLDFNHPETKDVLDEIREEVQVIADNYREAQAVEEKQDEWKLLSVMLDRLFFWIFVVTLVISSAATLIPVYLKYNPI